MPSKNHTLEEDYDTVIHTVSEGGDISLTDYTYTMNDITIDINEIDTIDNSMLPDGTINVTDHTIDITNNDMSWIFDGDIGTSSMYENLCDYIGIDFSEPPEDLKKMCERYPSLQKALEQFKNTYNLVKDDWRNDND